MIITSSTRTTMQSKRRDETEVKLCKDIQQLVATVLDIRDYLTLEEERKIHLQFHSSSWNPNSQVLWSGMLREDAQKWADERNMQTLTTAMGPLMAEKDPLCPRRKMSLKAWSKYIHGASAVFAWHIAKGNKVTVLCPPPPQRFHPSGRSYFQVIEQPILRLEIAKGAEFCIELIHPGVKGAEDYRYQLWPSDEEQRWTTLYGSGLCYKCKWRMVKGGQSSTPTSRNPVRGSLPITEASDINGPLAKPASALMPLKKPSQSSKKRRRKKKRRLEGKNRLCCSSPTSEPADPGYESKEVVKARKAVSASSAPKSKSVALSANKALSKKQKKALNQKANNTTPAKGPSKSHDALPGPSALTGTPPQSSRTPPVSSTLSITMSEETMFKNTNPLKENKKKVLHALNMQPKQPTNVAIYNPATCVQPMCPETNGIHSGTSGTLAKVEKKQLKKQRKELRKLAAIVILECFSGCVNEHALGARLDLSVYTANS